MEKATRNRLALLVLAVGLVSSAIGYRLYQLQILKGDDFRQLAHGQQRRTMEISATRGAILDRNGRELAVSVETQSLFVHPWRVEDPRAAAKKLARVLKVSDKTLLKKLRSDKPFVYLKRFLDAEAERAIREAGLPIGDAHAFGFLPESKRFYPGGELAVHVVGFATIDGAGVEGIEKQFDYELQGDPTTYLVQVDARDGKTRQLIRAPEKEPQDVVLSIDMVLQHIVERELDRAMRRTGARAASAIVMDPSTGYLLALANRPAADLRRYGQATDEERSNRAVVHLYEPGSTFKVVSLAAALENGAVRTDQVFYCHEGRMDLGNRRIRDTSPHGTLSVRDIIVRSSNIGMVQILDRVESQTFRDMIVSFGFASKTGIELPGEREGTLQPVSRWSDFSHDSLAFGQEIGVTVLQMTSALAVIAGDGVLSPPRVVLGIRDSSGLRRYPPAPTRRVITPRTARMLSSMMERVVTHGTGKRAAVAGYRVAGKSGTAQKALPGGGYSDSSYMASFGGFAPVDAPRLVAMVVLDSPRGHWQHGGQVAAPVFGRIVSDALRYLRVPQTVDPIPSPQPPVATGDRRALLEDGTGPGRVPDLRGLSLREATSVLAAQGYHARVKGSGIVVAQHPAAGQELAPGGTCTLRLADPPPRAAVAVRSASARGSFR